MIAYTIHKAHRLVITTLSEEVDGASVIAFYRKLYALPDWHPGMNELIDIRNADVSRVSADAMRVLARIVGDAQADAAVPPLTAAVVGSDYQYGMSRMYEGLAAGSPEEVRHFRDVLSALRWLGVPDDLYR